LNRSGKKEKNRPAARGSSRNQGKEKGVRHNYGQSCNVLFRGRSPGQTKRLLRFSFYLLEMGGKRDGTRLKERNRGSVQHRERRFQQQAEDKK